MAWRASSGVGPQQASRNRLTQLFHLSHVLSSKTRSKQCPFACITIQKTPTYKEASTTYQQQDKENIYSLRFLKEKSRKKYIFKKNQMNIFTSTSADNNGKEHTSTSKGSSILSINIFHSNSSFLGFFFFFFCKILVFPNFLIFIINQFFKSIINRIEFMTNNQNPDFVYTKRIAFRFSTLLASLVTMFLWSGNINWI